MCRMAAYLGPEIQLEQFLLEPRFNMIEQARHPQETCYTTVNADGFGIGWYTNEGSPAVYLNPQPIWSDCNLRHLGHALSADLWLANVRSATDLLPTSVSNTQPFWDDELLFMHNGFIRDFETTLRPILHRYIDPEIQAGVHGNTDSEFLFALLRHVLRQNEDLSIDGGIAAMFELLGEYIGETPAMLNLIVCDGEAFYAARHAINDVCPSLYYTTDDDTFPNAQLIASERLTESEYWQALPEHSILILDPEQPPELFDL